MENERGFTRREVLTAAAATGAAVTLYWLGRPLYERVRDANEGFIAPSIPGFPDIPDRVKLPEATGWNAGKLEAYLNAAVSQSLETQLGVLVELPLGEVVGDRKVKIEVPKGALIKLTGHEKGSRLRLAEPLSKVPRSNLLEFTNIEGEVQLEGIDFDGGSLRAGKGGYEAPPDPWDAIVILRGGRGNEKGGSVRVSNCRFGNSESVGLVTENLDEVRVQNIVGKNLDGAWTANWCRNIQGKNIIAENSLSDGLYIVECEGGTIEGVLVKGGRQGVDIHGSDNLTLRNINVLDFGLAFVNSRSLRTGKHSNNLTLEGFYSKGCGYIFSLGYLKGAQILRGSHDEAGKWFSGQDFMHRGVQDYDAISHFPLYIDYSSLEGVSFNGVQVRKATFGASSDYKEVPFKGIKYYNFSS